MGDWGGSSEELFVKCCTSVFWWISYDNRRMSQEQDVFLHRCIQFQWYAAGSDPDEYWAMFSELGKSGQKPVEK